MLTFWGIIRKGEVIPRQYHRRSNAPRTCSNIWFFGSFPDWDHDCPPHRSIKRLVVVWIRFRDNHIRIGSRLPLQSVCHKPGSSAAIESAHGLSHDSILRIFWTQCLAHTAVTLWPQVPSVAPNNAVVYHNNPHRRSLSPSTVQPNHLI